MSRSKGGALAPRSTAFVLGSLMLSSISLQAPERTDAEILHAVAASPGAPGRLVMATYNVWGFPDWLSPAPDERYGWIRDELRDLAPDVVALQEVWTDAALAAVPDGAGWSRVRGSLESVPLHENGLVTATRLRVLDAASHHFVHEAGRTSLFTSKGALFTALALPGGGVAHVWNTHLHSGDDPRDDAVRLLQVEELIGWMAAAAGPMGDPASPRVVCLLGDLNCVPGSAPFERLAGWLARRGHLGASTGLPPTYDPPHNPWSVPESPKALDHGLVASPALAAFRAERILDRGDARLDGRPLSDHFGVRIVFEVTPSNGAAAAAVTPEGAPETPERSPGDVGRPAPPSFWALWALWALSAPSAPSKLSALHLGEPSRGGRPRPRTGGRVAEPVGRP